MVVASLLTETRQLCKTGGTVTALFLFWIAGSDSCLSKSDSPSYLDKQDFIALTYPIVYNNNNYVWTDS